MTHSFRFSPTDMIVAGDTAYRPIETQSRGILLERVGQPGITQLLAHPEVREILRRPDTQYYQGYFERAHQGFKQNKCVSLVNELPDEIRALVLWRVSVCRAFLVLEAAGEISRTDKGYMEGLAKLAIEVDAHVRGQGDSGIKARPGTVLSARKLPRSRTAFTWLRIYIRSGFQAASLIPETHRCGNNERRWCYRSEALMNQVIEIYASTQRPSKTAAVRDTLALFREENERRAEAGAQPLVIPSSSTIRRRLNGASPYYVYSKRYGTAAANAKFTLYETGANALLPMERVEMDELKLDVISFFILSGIWDHLSPERKAMIERGRRWVYVAIDCATRCILSLRLVETPNADDAVRALRDVMRDKSDVAKAADCEGAWNQHGGIGVIVTDQGRAFVSETFQGALASIGASWHLPPAGLPWLRGTIESLFKTFSHKLMPLLAGRTFFSSQERGDYPSEQLACLCDEDLIKVLLTFVVDIYHNEPHASLKGETPNDAWKRLTAEHGVPPIPDGLTLCKAFGRPLQRKLRGDGVMFSGLTYSCDALREAFLHSTKRDVEIRVDLQNMDWIGVKVGASWYPAIANQSGFENVTYAELTEATRALRLRHGKAAELNAETIQRAISRIEEVNRNALRLRGLTPFHVTDAEVDRNQAALHFPIRADAERLSLTSKTKDPLKDGIFITRKLSSPTPRPESRPATPKDASRTPRWRVKDDE